MNSPTGSLKDLGLTIFLVVVFMVAGCWAYTQEPTASPQVTETPPSDAQSVDDADEVQPIAVNADEPQAGAPSRSTGRVILAAAETAKSEGASNERPPEPMLKNWKKPKLAIVLSGEQNGYLEPCGCSEKQSGGFARRADLFAQIQAKKWPIAAFDLGGTLKRSRRHDQLKFQKILEGFNLMHYQALGLGPAELRLGAEQLLSMHAPEKGLAFVSANVVFFGTPDLGTPLPYKLVEVNGVKIGVTSVLGNYYRDQVIPREQNDPNQPITVNDPTTSTAAAFEKIKAESPDLTILLSYCKVEETKELAKKVPGFDVIITAGGPEEPLETTERIGNSMLVQVGGKGKHVAVLGYYPDDAKQKLRYELVDLDRFRFKNPPRMEELMRDFQAVLAEANLAETEKSVAHESGAEFVGAKKCGQCHKKAYTKWAGTKHAHAYESLIKGPSHYVGQWTPRNHDVECLACHVTGWDPREMVRFDTGFQSLEKTAHLLNQQCENCHGPGSEHTRQEELFKKHRKANDPQLIKARQKIHLDEALAQKETGCYKCHDGDNSPKFKFAEFYKQISHKGMKD